MKKHYIWAAMLMAPAFVACSDITVGDVNTDAAVQVKDLSLPVKLDAIRLGTMLDVEDDDLIRVINGEYAVVVDGEFESGTIRVEPIVVKAADAQRQTDTMSKSRPGAKSKAKRAVELPADAQAVAMYALSQLKMVVAANADEIHDAIQKLSEIEAETTFKYSVSLGTELFAKVNQVHLEDFTVKAPRGINFEYVHLLTDNGKNVYSARYDSSTGLVSFSGQNIFVASDGVLTIEGKILGFNADLLEDALKDAVGTASASRAKGKAETSKSFAFDEEVGIESGDLVVYNTDFKNKEQTIEEMYESLDDQIDCSSETELEDIVINSVSGSFNYDVDDVALEDVDLSDIPDILSESGTDLRLDNPQVYLYLNNSVIDGAGKAVGATTEMTITAHDAAGHSRSYAPDETLAIDKADNFLYLAPHAVDEAQKYEGFAGAKHVNFNGLGNVLSSLTDGGGLPTSLGLTTTNTHVGADNVQELALGKDYGLTGRYVFVAPLALSENSSIKYTDTIDGWAEDTKDLVISKIGLSASATTDVPIELLLKVTPINAAGKRIGETSTLLLPANAKDAPIAITLSGDIRNLDGLKIDATATSKEARALSPDMTIALDGIKVTVSGEYDVEL